MHGCVGLVDVSCLLEVVGLICAQVTSTVKVAHTDAVCIT